MTEKSTSLSACGALARQYDSDRFFSALFAAAEVREKLFTLMAFNQEIAKIRSIVSEPILGQMRLQWWRETIEGMQAGKPAPAHEVGAPLGKLLKAEPQLAEHLFALLDARERDLDDTPFAGVDELAAYARATSAPLLAAMGEVNEDVATGYALVGILRAIPAELQAGRCRLADANDIPAIQAKVEEVAALAGKYLAGKAKGQARLWQVLARSYLKQLRRVGHDVTDYRFQQPYTWRGLALLWAHLTG